MHRKLLSLLIISIICNQLVFGVRTDQEKQVGGVVAQAPGLAILDVTGIARVSLASDVIKIGIEISTRRATAIQALSDNNIKVSKIVQGLKNLGVKDQDISTVNFSINPHFKQVTDPSGNISNVQDGFNVNQSIEVQVTNLTLASKIVDFAVSNGALINYVDFSVSNTTAKTQRVNLINMAIDDAYDKANITVSKLKYRIVGIREVYILENGLAGAGGLKMAMAADTNLLGAKETLIMSIRIVFTISQ